jgi:hypothetical protein
MKRFRYVRSTYIENGIRAVGYFSSTIGLNEDQIKKYIVDSVEEEETLDQTERSPGRMSLCYIIGILLDSILKIIWLTHILKELNQAIYLKIYFNKVLMKTYSSSLVNLAYFLVFFGTFFIIATGFDESFSGHKHIYANLLFIPVYAGAFISLRSVFLYRKSVLVNSNAFRIFMKSLSVGIPGVFTLFLTLLILIMEIGTWLTNK